MVKHLSPQACSRCNPLNCACNCHAAPMTPDAYAWPDHATDLAVAEATNAVLLGIIYDLLQGRTNTNRIRPDSTRRRPMPDCASEWFAGLTCDHLYDNCPSRRRGENELRAHGWWDLGQKHNPPTQIDPHGPDVCGICVHRHNRTSHRESA